MKQNRRNFLCLAFVMLVSGFIATPAFADLPHLRKAIDDLQAAKESSNPMPLLQSARKHLNEANRGNKVGDRNDALDKVKEAIAELKAGDRKKMEQKINAAIANIHQGKDKAK